MSKSHTCHFNGHFTRKVGVASCSLDSQLPFILIPSITVVWTKCLHIIFIDTIPPVVMMTNVKRPTLCNKLIFRAGEFQFQES